MDKDLIIQSLLIEIQRQAKIILAYESSYKLKDEIIKVKDEVINDKDELIAVYQQADATQKSLIEHLTNNQKKDSSNSSKPPSSDFGVPKRTKSLREKTDKKVGGQQGHKGTTLDMSSAPHETLIHKVDKCYGCGKGLQNTKVFDYERRQVFDVPPLAITITEHRCEIKNCICGIINKALFPEHVKQPVQYGPTVQSIGVYLTNNQLIPYNRAAKIFEDLLNLPLSSSFLVNNNKRFASSVKPLVENLSNALLTSSLLYVDETGVKINGTTNWLHTASTDKYSLYFVHSKRGVEAMNEMGILPTYKGALMHDFWKPYNTFLDCSHHLCNVHHLRDLTFCHEVEKSEAAGKLKKLLLDLHTIVEKAREAGKEKMTKGQIIYWNKKYNTIVSEGLIAHPIAEKTKIKQGVVKKSKTQNMFLRFRDYKDQIFGFVKDFKMPFSNNIAEQAIRMMKVKLKISGCFRTIQGAQDFAIVRSFIETVRKQKQSILFAIASVINGNPIVLV